MCSETLVISFDGSEPYWQPLPTMSDLDNIALRLYRTPGGWQSLLIADIEWLTEAEVKTVGWLADMLAADPAWSRIPGGWLHNLA